MIEKDETEKIAEETAISKQTETAGHTDEPAAFTEENADTPEQKSKPSKSKKKTGKLSRKSQKMISSAVISIMVIAAIILVNVISDVLTSKYSAMTADLTSAGNFDISDQTLKIVSDLKKESEIIFLRSKNDYESYAAYENYGKQTSVIANQMAKNSNGMLSVTYIDLIQNPTYANDYTEELSESNVIVKCGDKYKILTEADLFNFGQYSSQYSYIVSSKSEQAFDNALVTVTSDVSTKVALITDNTNSDYSYLKNTLISNNYNVQEISLEKDSIAADTETVIIYAPSKDFTSDAVEKLRKYLINNEKYGKNVLYIPYENKVEMPNLDDLIDVFGMKIDDGLAFDMDTNMLMGTSYYDGIACTYASKDYQDNISDDDAPVIVGLARPIEITNDNVAYPLLTLSASGSGYSPFSAVEGQWSMTDAITGNVCVMAQGQLGNDNGTSTLVVAGSRYMFTDSYLGSNFSNSTYLFNMLASLNNRDTSTITVKEKVVTDYDISLSQSTAFMAGSVVFLFIPILILGTGFTVYLVRRNK